MIIRKFDKSILLNVEFSIDMTKLYYQTLSRFININFIQIEFMIRTQLNKLDAELILLDDIASRYPINLVDNLFRPITQVLNEKMPRK